MPHLLETKPAVQIGHRGKMVAAASTLAIIMAAIGPRSLYAEPKKSTS